MEPLQWLYVQTRGGLPRARSRMEGIIAELRLSEPEHLVLVAGTNGKGTIATSLGHGLTTAGYRTGVFTSPHVEQFNERIAIDGELISDDDVEQYIAWLQANPDTIRRYSASFFELTLAMALKYFADHGVTHAVIEAGVGVQRDATNALKNYDLSIISNVTVDHANVFGGGIREIAQDKAYATRAGIHTITGAIGEALEIIRDRSEAVGGQLHLVDDSDPLFAAPRGARPELRIAAAAARLLELPPEAVDATFDAPPLPARREYFRLGSGRRIILDGAHNIAAAERLVDEVPKPYVLVFGALAKKDGSGIFDVLSRHATEVYTTRADPFEESFQLPELQYIEHPVRALQHVVENMPPHSTVVVAGSFYLAGTLRPWLRKLQQRLQYF